MKKILASLCLAIGFTLPNFISYKFVCATDERWPDFYGFPFVQNTDRSWVFSMSGKFFISGFIGNVIFWGLLFYVIIRLLNLLKHRVFIIVRRVILITLCLFSLWVIYFELTLFDWRLQWNHDDFKMNYYQQKLDCKRTFHFFD
ncbi:hypothetical protein [Olleya sp. YS]|uniref:hypothetical protein n=1 Tax=Olleya sp. YS TaxID=3028318 RepID=UPI0024341D61|nr:hypothetical protein [Olleya sp. YS]WGD34754.1 hypothetical protein Ollyesu_13305 [Olleya sp. YS]